MIDSNLLQYSHPGQGGEVDVVIGLDFGTSASKVVIQVHGIPGNPAYAVDFGDLAHASMRYLLPTRISVAPDGVCSLEITEGTRIISDIKLELFLNSEVLRSQSGPTNQNVDPEAAAAAYLALLLRFARRWFLESKRDLLAHLTHLNWGLNLGVPSPCLEENEENDRFQRIGKAGWLLSVLEDEITIGKAQDRLRQVAEAPEYLAQGDETVGCDFAIIPEIAAGAIGYAFSELRREGLHLMIDVGASTVDVCSFVLHDRDGTDCYELLTADVKGLGTIRLHHERIRAISDVYSAHAEELRDHHDPMKPISSEKEEYLVSTEKILDAIEQGETNLKAKTEKMIRKITRDLWMRRDKNSDVWSTSLPLLVIGGGSRAQFFREIADGLGPWLRNVMHNDGTTSLPVSVPKTICEDPLDHDRLVVAWGLSHQEFNIGEITPADQIDDVALPPTRGNYQDRFVGQEHV